MNGTFVATRRAMTLFDSFIIYLAIGSAFAAWRMTRKNIPISSNKGTIALTFLFWPVTFVRLIASKSETISGASGEDFAVNYQSDAESTAESIVEIVPIQLGDPRFYEFRESLERYVGLGEAIRRDAESSVQTLLKIEQKSPNELQLRVHSRNNKRKLFNHFVYAGDEVLKAAVEILEAKPDSTSFKEELLRLFDSFSDEENARKLNSLRLVNERGTTATMEVTGWIPQKET